MAAALKDQFGPSVPRTIADMLVAVHNAFPRAAFLRDALDGYEPLSLTERARRISRALRTHLPADYAQAIRLLGALRRGQMEGVERSGPEDHGCREDDEPVDQSGEHERTGQTRPPFNEDRLHAARPQCAERFAE